MPHTHYRPNPPPSKAPSLPADWIVGNLDCRHILTCPSMKTLTAWWEERNAWAIFGLPCRRWSCGFCARLKIQRLANQVGTAAPNKLLTLTVDPSRWQTPREAFEATAKRVPDLISNLRTRFGPVEYLRVTEVTRAGYPHYHLLVRSAYLPHPVVKAEWNRLTGATIVDLRLVHKTFSAYWYLVKYLSKLHKLEWTERHVSYSKQFFRPDPDFQKEACTLQGKARVPEHPWIYMAQRHRGQILRQLRILAWLSTEEPSEVPCTIDPMTYGLPRSFSEDWVSQQTQLNSHSVAQKEAF